MKIILVRHGESEDNALKIIQRFNSPLTEKGKLDAIESAKK